jgi:fibro-slime domain-containing protein
MARCGDGIKFPEEACDDGNTRSGDGCSDVCAAESGFACELIVDESPEKLDFPIIYRDFRGWDMPADPARTLPRGHIDFQYKNGEEKGIVKAQLGADKKPVYNKPSCTPASGNECKTHGAAAFDMWYRDAPGYNITVPDQLQFTRQANGSYVYENTNFFPLNGKGWMAAPWNAEFVNRNHCWRAPGATTDTCAEDGSNFHFTSELRYWFEYKSTGARLDFFGDDDVWVFVNGKLALDLGGIHGALPGTVELREGTAPNVKSRSCLSNNLTNCTDVEFNLEVGKIYEVVVFQAERHETKSEYKLTLRGFEKAISRCASVCGDAIVAADETCDDGKNDGTYGSCTADCQSVGPSCGDKVIQYENGETCDDGNRDTSDGCDNACNKTGTILI